MNPCWSESARMDRIEKKASLERDTQLTPSQKETRKEERKRFRKQPSRKSLLCCLNVGDNLDKGMQDPLSDKKKKTVNEISTLEKQ